MDRRDPHRSSVAPWMLAILAIGLSAGTPARAVSFLQAVDSALEEGSERPTLTAVTAVEVDVEPLLSGTDRLEISLPAHEGGPERTLFFVRRVFEDRGSGRVTWQGSGSDGQSEAVITVQGERMAAWLRDGEAVWTVAPTATGHRLARVVPRAFPGCGESLRPSVAGVDLAPTPQPSRPSSASQVPMVSSLTSLGGQGSSKAVEASHGGSPPPLDILVLYTPEAREEQGGREAIETLIQNGVDLLNTAFTNSAISARARLVGVRETVPALVPGQPPMGDTLRNVTNDGNVRRLRDQLQADMVSLWISAEQDGEGTLCGLAWAMDHDSVGPQFQRFAVSVLRAECAVDNLTFPHELGHNLGGFHEPQGTPRDEASFPWSFGHTGGRSFRTILATGVECPSNSPFGCPRIPNFSNPAIESFGLPTGVAGDRDLHRTFTETIPVTARFRGQGSSTLPAPGDLQAEVISADSVTLRWTDRAADEDAYQVEFAVGGEAFRVFDRVPAESTTALVDGLDAETLYRFRVRTAGFGGLSAPSNVVELTTPAAPPEAPSDLRFDEVQETRVLLSWEATPGTVTRIERSSPGSGFREVAAVAVNSLAAPQPGDRATVSLEVDDLDSETPYTFRVRTERAGLFSPYSESVSVTTAGASGPCRRDGLSLCLLDDRFEVRVAWRNPRSEDGSADGVGRAVEIPDSEISGLFWFFDEANIELIVKMLDGTDLNGFVWHFWGALTDVQYWISVRNTETDARRTFHNPPFEICGGADVEAFFQGEGAIADGVSSAPPSAPPVSTVSAPGTTPPPCLEDADTLCLAGDRFQVEVAWANPRPPENAGVAGTLPGLSTGDTGLLWFFQPENIELVVKILDAQVINGHYWLFWGALTDVQYTLTVTDTVDGSVHVFENSAFEQCGGAELEVL